MTQHTQHFAFLLVSGFAHLAFANAVEPLRIANLVSGQDLYRWSFGSLDGSPARASNGSQTLVDYTYLDVPRA
ncbi:MAG: GlxA family transcriptional regulator, partial [Paracoccaceae bacterium]